MSQNKKSAQEMGFDSLANQFGDSLSFEENKPDFRELDLGSPVSPLRIRTGATAVNGSSTNSSVAAISSGSSSSSDSVSNKLGNKPNAKANHHSDELSACSHTIPNVPDTIRSAPTTRSSKLGHRRSVSAGVPLIYSGGRFGSSSTNGHGNSASSVSSNTGNNFFPSGNVCPTGKILKSSIASRPTHRSDVLGSGTANYGHGNIMRSGAKLSNAGHNVDDSVNVHTQAASESLVLKRAMASSDPEEVKKAGNDFYRRGSFKAALSLYDRAISLSPDNSAYRSNRAAALTALGRLDEAVKECQDALNLDPGYSRAHQRLASLYMRLVLLTAELDSWFSDSVSRLFQDLLPFGLVESARRHLCSGKQFDDSELQKLKLLEKHLNRCADARKLCDWKGVIRESDAAIATAADSSPLLVSCKAEAFLKLNQIEDAETCLSNILRPETCPSSCSGTTFFGMLAEAYVAFVRAQIEMAIGRFDDSIISAENAAKIDYSSAEVAKVLNIVKMVAKARSKGNELFSSGKYDEACSAYGEGLRYDGSNSVLYCNRAACWFKLGQWEQSILDCNRALKIQSNYTKALLRRAASNSKLGRWAEVVKDYELLKRALPGDSKIDEALRQAQHELKKYHEEIQCTKLGGQVEEIFGLDKYRTAISSPGILVVHFKEPSNVLCEEISPIVNMLCLRYPTIKFYMVNVEENAAVWKTESIRAVPTFKIYKNGEKLMELNRPSHRLLEDSIKSCCNL